MFEFVDGVLSFFLFVLMISSPILLPIAIAIPLHWFAQRKFRFHLSTAVVLMICSGISIPMIRWIIASYIQTATDWDSFPIVDEIVHLIMLLAVLTFILWIVRIWEGGIQSAKLWKE